MTFPDKLPCAQLTLTVNPLFGVRSSKILALKVYESPVVPDAGDRFMIWGLLRSTVQFNLKVLMTFAGAV